MMQIKIVFGLMEVTEDGDRPILSDQQTVLSLPLSDFTLFGPDEARRAFAQMAAGIVEPPIMLNRSREIDEIFEATGTVIQRFCRQKMREWARDKIKADPGSNGHGARAITSQPDTGGDA